MVDCDDLQNDAEALNWAYFWLGRYRSDAARLYRADAEGNPVDLLAEIKPPEWVVARDREYASGVNLPTRAAREKAADGNKGPTRRTPS